MTKRILVIMESMGGGGAEKALLPLLGTLCRDGYAVTLLLLRDGGPHRQSIPEGVNTVALWDRMPRGLWRIPEVLRRSVFRRVARRRLGADARFDTVMSYLEGPAAFAHSSLMHLGSRHLTWVHVDLEVNPWADRFFSFSGQREFYSAVDNIAFVSEGCMAAFSRRFGIADRCHVVGNMIPADSVREASAEKRVALGGRMPIVFVGRLSPQKNPSRLLQAVSLCRQRGADVTLTLVGDGPLRGQLEEEARNLGLEGCCRFVGFCSNPYPYVAAASLFLLASDTEGWPLVVAESLIIGTPVVATRVTGPTEMLAGGGGVLADCTPESLADAVMGLYDNPSELARLAAETQIVASHFSPEGVFSHLLPLL